MATSTNRTGGGVRFVCPPRTTTMVVAIASARAIVALAKPSTLSLLTGQRLLKFKALCSSSVPSRKLVLYSKPGCCLCDGLKEKLQAAFLLPGPDSINDIDLQVRDITTNPEWEKAYQYEIPVLAKVLSDGTEETLPRMSPRLGVEHIQKKIAAALREQ